MLRRVFRLMSRFAFRCARFRNWYIGRFSGKFPVECKKDSFCADFWRGTHRSHWSHGSYFSLPTHHNTLF
jgi:hypothetical protein